MRASLREFLTEGRLGPIAFSITKATIRQWLGTGGNVDRYDPKGRRRKNLYTTWQYGQLQLGFNHDILTFIGLYFRDQTSLPPTMSIEGYYPTEETTLEDMIAYLEAEGIRHERHAELSKYDQVAMVAGVGVHIYFSDGDNKLDSLQYLDPRH